MNSNAAEASRRILVIDDNESIHADFRKILNRDVAADNDLKHAAASLLGGTVPSSQETNFELQTALQGQDGLAAVQEAIQSGRPFEMAFVDVRMPPGWDGIETVGHLWEADPDLQIVICTAYSDYSWDEMMKRLGQSDRLVILKKPFDTMEVLQLASTLTEKYRLRQQVKQQMAGLEQMVLARTEDLRKNEELFRLITENAVDMIGILNAEGRWVYTSPSFEKLLGHSSGKLANSLSFDLVHPEDQNLLRIAVGNCISNGARNILAFRARHRDGSWRHLESYIVPFSNPRHVMEGALIVARDITERTSAEKKLRDSEDKLRAIWDSLPVGITIIDPETHKIVEANPEAVRLIGAPREQVVGAVCHKHICPAAQGACPITDLKQTVDNSERVLLTANHESLSVLKSVTRINFGGREHLLEIFNDITARKQTETALQQSEERFRQFAENVREVFWMTSADWTQVLYVSPAYEQVWGRTCRSLYEKPTSWLEAVHPEDRASVHAAAEQQYSGFLKGIEYRIQRPDGTIRWIRDRAYLINDGAGQVCRVAGVAEDITERKQMELALSGSRHFLDRIINTVANPIFVKDRDHRAVLVNDAYCHFLGRKREELVGKSDLDFFPKEEVDEFWSKDELVFNTEKENINEEKFTDAAGNIHTIVTRKTLYTDEAGKKYIVGVIQDITERKRAEQALQQSERKFRTLFENARDAMFIIDLKGRFVDANREACDRLQYSRDELLQLTVADIDTPENAALMPERIQQVLQKGHILFETITRRRGGSTVPVEINTQALEHEGQTLIMAAARDLTERKRSEQALRDSEEKYRGLFENSRDAILTEDPATGKFTSGNPAAMRMFGAKDEQELISFSPAGLSPEHQPDGSLSAEKAKLIEEIVVRDGSHNFEWTHRRINGEEFPADVLLTLMTSGGKPMVLSTIRDITDRKRAEKQLRLQTSALTATANGILITDASGRILWANPAFTRLTGYEADEAIGKTPALLKSGVEEPVFYEKLWETILGGAVWQGELVNRRKDGSLYHEEMTIAPVLDERGKVKNFVAIKQDISQRKKDEAKLRAREGAFRALADNVPDAVARMDRNFRFVYGNRALARDMGSESSGFLGKSGEELNLPCVGQWRTELRRVFETGHARSFEFQWPGPKGICCRETRLVPERSSNGVVEHVLAMTRDVTEQKKAEKERQVMEVHLRQAQKMEAIGQLAAGIAHEINTPTQYVGDNTRFLKEAFDSILHLVQSQGELLTAAKQNALTPELLKRLEESLKASDLEYLSTQVPQAIQETLEGVERVTKIVRAMKDFSHPGSREKTAADLNKAIETTVTVARNEWKYVSDLNLNLDPELPPVPCFVGEFNQVILNLVVNAAQAIGDVVKQKPGTKGAITVSTRCEGDHVAVRVSDTGTGIPESNRHRIFEPFFTTKEVGKGSGQGLALVYNSIVKKHGGTVTFETEVGKGTTFIIRLPIRPAHPPAAKSHAAALETTASLK